MCPLSARNLTLRDPDGALYAVGDRLVRQIMRNGNVIDLKEGVVKELISEGLLVKTWVLASEDSKALSKLCNTDESSFWEHEKVWFPSYPYEWPADMLHAAGLLTMDLCVRLHGYGLGLKDATPYNILFQGPHPIFVDLPSIERRRATDPIWNPFAQFQRTFVLPLILNRCASIPLDMIFLTHRDALAPTDVYQMLAWWRRWLPSIFGAVTLPHFFSNGRIGSREALYRQRSAEKDAAHFILGITYRGLQKKMQTWAPKLRASRWSKYLALDKPYTSEQLEQKIRIVRSLVREERVKRVLDIGCNQGMFSQIAAEEGSKVVAIDRDPHVIGRVWRMAKEKKLGILPLVVDFNRPTPSTGWGNREGLSFLQRGKGAFDLVLFLAIYHHVVIGDGVPLEECLGQVAKLTRNLALVEYIGPNDPSFKHLAKGRDFSHLSLSRFEEGAASFFSTLRKEPIPGSDRILFVLRKK